MTYTGERIERTLLFGKRKRRNDPYAYHKSAKTPWGNPIVYILSLLLVLICVVPVLYIILGGFRTNSQITRDPAGMPNPWNFENYATVVSSSTFWVELVNSLIVSVGTMVGVVVLALMVSFVIARYRFRFSRMLYTLFSAGMMFPITVAITPLYLLLRNLHLINSQLGIILPQIAFGLPQAIIILVPFLQSIPMELEEAAQLDGCSRLGFFARMVLPLSGPGVATIAILSFVASWNAYMLPLFLLNDSTKYTLPLGVQMFSSQHSVDTAQVLAFTSLSMIPALICFTIFQKKIVGGLAGAVKG
ncbi:carbohydrate ABC transporter permease [Bifidobacterium pseudolongum]|uniref:Thiamine ABC transporter ATP-binding protein n=1 Tax=Bifidobacterium pseudolongum subsp. globosum TaxID=1690 RepID=A0A4Q5A847_9BIFI|nr:carbohydrate ABC transporter permease [Bifidobacterium pseudolongum]MCH4851100.1 carbohydrate ABC transporter permease [Bifidobacterium pseudolongum]RYQ19734.1 thiamine ABC transporter ATP-binding protein [Bifidobacterium pseudolongum subsp. globosum]RYQ33853.1 thiamine ABC transporter ATP-binding protein [Bifidobacterium pseudolongum subsp. globosum]RYQ38618.1 thiamine ABC transporter ATP-binding protein [Bifidobacterium pseudolongum subsp. globosum]RYQ73870.1 thiamine ABC transporter ATP-